LKSANPDLNVEILGINQVGDSAFNDLVISESQLPWLQDTQTENVWARWQVVYRDVRILDARNQVHAVFNLTDNDLADADNREALKQLFLQAAKAADSDKDSLPDAWEERYFGNLAALPTEDPDGDGANNFSEFALGTNPLNAKSNSSIRTALLQDQSAFWSLTFQRRAGAFLDYFIENSRDLKLWTPLDITVTPASQNLFDGTGTLQQSYRLLRPDQNQRSGFIRIRALPRQRN
jgi:hypothetical protein